jgi:hypothetical protein
VFDEDCRTDRILPLVPILAMGTRKGDAGGAEEIGRSRLMGTKGDF